MFDEIIKISDNIKIIKSDQKLFLENDERIYTSGSKFIAIMFSFIEIFVIITTSLIWNPEIDIFVGILIILTLLTIGIVAIFGILSYFYYKNRFIQIIFDKRNQQIIWNNKELNCQLRQLNFSQVTSIILKEVNSKFVYYSLLLELENKKQQKIADIDLIRCKKLGKMIGEFMSRNLKTERSVISVIIMVIIANIGLITVCIISLIYSMLVIAIIFLILIIILNIIEVILFYRGYKKGFDEKMT